MADDFNDGASDPEVQDLLSYTSGGGQSPGPEIETAEPEPAAAQPQSQQPAPATAPTSQQQPQPWANSPLAPLAQRLPPGLQRRVAAGEMALEDAVTRHYQGYVNNVDRANAAARAAREQNAQLAGRLEKLMSRLNETLGLQVDEEQEAQQPDPLRDLSGKVDQVLQLEEERRTDVVVDQVLSYSEQDREVALAEVPNYAEAEQFVANNVIRMESQGVRRELTMWSSTRDPRYLQNIPREYLQAFVDGMIDEEELVTKVGLERAMDAVAQIQHRHFQGRTSMAQEVIGIAQRMGWTPGGSAPASGAPPPPPRPMQPTPPAPPRQDPNLGRIRRNMTHQPAPSGSGGIDPQEAARRVANMDTATFDQMIADSDDPKALIRHLTSLAATLH